MDRFTNKFLSLFYVVVILLIIGLGVFIYNDHYSFTISEKEVVMLVGEKYTLNLYAKNIIVNEDDYDITLSNENLKIDGFTLTAEKEGSTHIEVKSKKGFKVENVYVTAIESKITSLSIKDAITSYVGESKKLNVVINDDASIKADLKYESLNPEIAEVDKQGNVKGLSEGIATIKVTYSEDIYVYMDVEIKKKEIEVEKIIVPETIELIASNEKKIDFSIQPEDATNKNVTIISHNDSIVKVIDNEKILALRAGIATIEVKADNGKSAKIKVSVKDIEAYTNEKDNNNDNIKEYTVTFETDGGSTIANQIVKENGTVSKPTNPTKEWYNFAGWEYEGKSYDFNTPVTKDIKLYAQWDLKNANLSYNDLKNMLTVEINKKNFPDITKQFLYEILDGLYKNYPTYYKVYKNLPPLSEYVAKYYIDHIRNIEYLDMYADGTPEADKIQSVGAGYWDGEGIKLIYFDKDSIFYTSNHSSNIEAMFHEITHSGQRYGQWQNGIFALLVEGAATYNMRFTYDYKRHFSSNDSACNNINTLCAKYSKESGAGLDYLVFLREYGMLTYILGYDTMAKIEKGQLSNNAIKNMIISKTGYNFYDEIDTLLTPIWSGSPYSYDQAIKIEKMFIDVLYKDINALSTKGQVKKYIDVYRDYKSKYLPQIYKADGDEFKASSDATYEVLDIAKLDNLLADKIISTNIFPKFSSNANLNKMAVKVLLTSNDYFYSDTHDYYSTKLPFLLSDCKYYYYEKDGKGHLVLNYIDNSLENERNVYFEFVFDQNKIISANGVANPTKDSNYKSLY